MKFSKIEASYTSKDGCRLVWKGVEEDDSDTIILNKKELEQLIDLLKGGSAGEVELEDQVSRIIINSDVTEFNLKDHNLLEVKTPDLQKHVLDYAKIPHVPQYIYISPKEYYPSISIRKYDEPKKVDETKPTQISLLEAILASKPKKTSRDISQSDLSRIFATRRSTRKFVKTKIEGWMVDKILAAVHGSIKSKDEFSSRNFRKVFNPRCHFGCCVFVACCIWFRSKFNLDWND